MNYKQKESQGTENGDSPSKRQIPARSGKKVAPWENVSSQTDGFMNLLPWAVPWVNCHWWRGFRLRKTGSKLVFYSVAKFKPDSDDTHKPGRSRSRGDRCADLGTAAMDEPP